MPGTRGYRDLVVWQKAMDLAVECYGLTADFPRTEQYGITLQIRRAAVSVPSNIAEGKTRGGSGDYARFVGMASGSAAELETLILLCERLGYLSTETVRQVLGRAGDIGRMLTRLRAAVARTER